MVKQNSFLCDNRLPDELLIGGRPHRRDQFGPSASFFGEVNYRQKADHLLRDRLFNDAGHRMIATHATKPGVRYR
jgi:hypothetical protein